MGKPREGPGCSGALTEPEGLREGRVWLGTQLLPQPRAPEALLHLPRSPRPWQKPWGKGRCFRPTQERLASCVI